MPGVCAALMTLNIAPIVTVLLASFLHELFDLLRGVFRKPAQRSAKVLLSVPIPPLWCRAVNGECITNCPIIRSICNVTSLGHVDVENGHRDASPFLGPLIWSADHA